MKPKTERKISKKWNIEVVGAKLQEDVITKHGNEVNMITCHYHIDDVCHPSLIYYLVNFKGIGDFAYMYDN
jgi:hypothetical protein